MPNIPEVPKRELLAMEKETTGLYLSGHPMDEYRSLTQKAQAASVKQIIDDLTGESSRPVYKDGMTVPACVCYHGGASEIDQERLDDGVCHRGGRHGGD